MITYMTYFDAKKNSNKFWQVENNGTINTYRWGRVGDKGQTKTESFYDKWDAIDKMEKKIREKLNKGYTKKDIAQGASIATAEAKSETLSDTVAKFVKDIYTVTTKKVAAYLGIEDDGVATPIGKLGINGINKGKNILKNIVTAINNNDNYDIKYYSNQYFKAIPRKMSRRITEDEWVLNTLEKVDKELEVLNLYEDALNTIAKTTIDVDSMYKHMNCEVRDVTADELAYVTNKIATSHASNHHYTLKVVNAFKVEQKNAPAYDTTRGHDTMLFHGTRSENILGILSSNLKLPNNITGVVKTGAMFGPGLYFANNCTKSANYSFGYWSGSNTNRAYLFICKVALGNVKEYDNAHYCTKAPNGYDSVMGKKGAHLYNNEFIVYNENQVQIEYIVEVTK